MILKMLVFHWLKHSKQTWRGDPTNKQAQSVFSAVNTARWRMWDCDVCDCFSAVYMCMRVTVIVHFCLCVYFFSFLPVDFCVQILANFIRFLYLCISLYSHLCVAVFVCSIGWRNWKCDIWAWKDCQCMCVRVSFSMPGPTTEENNRTSGPLVP